MEDLSNRQPPPLGSTQRSEESSPSNGAPASPARQIDESAWLTICRSLHPWSPLVRLAAGKSPPLLWGTKDSDAAGLVNRLQRSVSGSRLNPEVRSTLQSFLASEMEIGEATALAAVAWAYSLPAVARQDSGDLAVSLLRRLIKLIDAPLPNATAADVLPQLWLKIELPLVLAHFANDTRLANSLRKGAIGAEARLAGTWYESRGEMSRPWLATIVRAQELLRGSEVEFSEPALERLDQLARQVLRLSRMDGSSILTTQAGTAADREFLTASVLAVGKLQPIAAAAFSKGAVEPKPVKGQPAAPQYSHKTSFAVLRNRWAAPATQATIDFSSSISATGGIWLDLTRGQHSLLHGDWQAQIRVNDTPLEPQGPWSEVCWHSDADCDYLEIECKLSGGWLLQRHVLLVRRDESLLLADSLLQEAKVSPAEFLASASSAPRLDYSTELPISPGIVFTPQQATREGHLFAGKKPVALVLPIALPEWRKQPCSGELTAASGALRHSLQTTGRNLFAPLWLDLNPNRFQKAEATWRQLTIGEALAVQPREVAVGYRVQVRHSQFLLYRSLAWRGNRTVLGKNFATDFACCRFHPNGETDEILEVQ